MNVKPANIVERWETQEEEAIVVSSPHRDKRHWTERYSLRLVLLLALGLTLCFGGKTDLAMGLAKLSIFGAAALIAAFVLLGGGESLSLLRLYASSKIYLAIFISFCTLVLFQLVPLPQSLLSFISPQADLLYQSSGAAVGRISLEPLGTVSQLSWLFALGLVVFWLLALPHQTIRTNLTSMKKRRQIRDSLQRRSRETDHIVDLLQRTIVGVAVVCSIIAIVQWTMRSTLLFGIFESKYGGLTQTRAHWPFVNPDHLSILLEIGIITAFARFLRIAQLRTLRSSSEHTENLSLRLLQSPGKLGKLLPYGLAILSMILCNVLALSRGGNILVIFGLLLLWWAYNAFPVRVEEDEPKRRTKLGRERILGIPLKNLSLLKKVAAVFIVGIIVLFFLGQSGRDMATRRIEYGLAAGYDESRAMLSETSLAVFSEYPILGAGLGAWHLAAAKYIPRDLAGWLLDYAHNDYLQLLAETGILGFVPLVLAGLFLLLLTRKAWRSLGLPTQRFELLGSFVALSLPLLHALVDFPFHIPALAFMVLLAFVVHIRLVERALSEKS